MGWATLHLYLDSTIEDYSGEVAYRAAARIVPQLATRFSTTRLSKERETPITIAILRGILINRVALDEVNVEVLRAAHEACVALDADANIFALVIRAVRAALRTTIAIGGRRAKVEETRKALQAANDLDENNYRGGAGLASRVGVWASAEKDIERLKSGHRLLPPLPSSYAESPAWRTFERHLIGFDESWKIWLLWLQYRLFGLATPEVPYQVWPKVERQMALMDEAFWRSSELAINSHFANLVATAVDAELEEEVEREQNAFGLTFDVSRDEIFEVTDSEPAASSTERRLSVVNEVVRNANDLLTLCQGNSTAHLHARVSAYLEALQNGGWQDDALVVMRGDALRKELQFQQRRDDDSDLPPLTQAIERSLEQTIRTHNILANLHPNLATLDKLLASPGSVPSVVPGEALRALAHRADTRRIASERAAELLARSVSEINQHGDEVSERRALYTVDNFFRSALRYLWGHKTTLAAAGTASSVFLYNLGHWAIANETLLRAYFATNPTMHLVGERLFAILRRIPLG